MNWQVFIRRRKKHPTIVQLMKIINIKSNENSRSAVVDNSLQGE